MGVWKRRMLFSGRCLLKNYHRINSTLLYMAWFEYAYRTGQLAKARSFALKLSPDRLLPGDVAFLNDALSKMAPDSQSASQS